MAPSGVKRIVPSNNSVNAAVLILVFPQNTEPHIVLIKRAEYPGIHGGQISLPGGKEEENDVNLEHTVLRETYEEIGLHPSKIELIGKLTPLFIPVSLFNVFPFVGICAEKPIWVPDKQEVSYIIEASLKDLLNPSNRVVERKKINGAEMDVPFFSINDEKIWGATAMIISEFLDIIHKTA
jgi:8-oxo-dGTP pyrophosphatase MutT (NUDIX family)